MTHTQYSILLNLYHELGKEVFNHLPEDLIKEYNDILFGRKEFSNDPYQYNQGK